MCKRVTVSVCGLISVITFVCTHRCTLERVFFEDDFVRACCANPLASLICETREKESDGNSLQNVFHSRGNYQF